MSHILSTYFCPRVRSLVHVWAGSIDDLIIALLEDFRAMLSEPQPINDISFNLDEPGLLT